MIISKSKAAALLCEQAKAKRDILLLCHRNPDGDTIGSAFALFYALKSLGCRVNVRCADAFPKVFSYLYPQFMDELTDPYIVSVDTASKVLLGTLEQEIEHVHLTIDHHSKFTQYADKLVIDTGAAAACEIVFDIIKEMNVPITPIIATSLYTGVVSDTGRFKFSNVTPELLTKAAELMRLGAAHELVTTTLELRTRARVKAESAALDDMEYFMDGRIAVLKVTKEIFTHSGVTEEELEGIASVPLCVMGVDISITIREQQDDELRVSLRTTDKADASQIAAHFGGGGHVRAAGCRIRRLKLPEAIPELVQKAMEQLQI